VTDERPLPMLRGERVWLRAAEPADLVATNPQVNDAETAHYFGVKWPRGQAGAEEFGRKLLSQSGKSVFPFTICRLGEDTAIGGTALRDVDRANGSAEALIFIGDKSAWGQGLGTDAMNALVDFGFGELRLERIQLHVFDYNRRAIRSYEKAGFQTDVIERRARFHRGRYHDVLEMSILRDDWLALERPRSWALGEPIP